jgi:DNA-binding transcriptional LysR family regulator
MSEVARALNYSHAASALHYSEPRLHQRVRAIERVLGITVFVREGRALTVTPAGSKLLAEARTILDEAQRLDRLVWELREEQTNSIVIGAQYPAIAVLPSLVAKLGESVNGLDIRLEVISAASDLLTRTLGGTVDIGFLREDGIAVDGRAAHGLVCTPWRDFHMVTVAASEYFDRFLSEMEHDRHVRLLASSISTHASQVIRAWQAQGIETRLIEVGISVGGAGLKQSALAGLGVALLPRANVEYELQSGRMRRFPSDADSISVSVYMIRRPGPHHEAAERAFHIFESAEVQASTI